MVSRRGRRNSGKWKTWRNVVLVVAIAWIAQEARFYFPKHIRPPKGVQPIEVTMKTTAYCHCAKCCSYHWFLFVPYQKTGPFSFRLKHVGETSSGAMARPGTIAADTSIYPYGTVMYIPGYGYGRVEDTGGAIKGNHIDLYRPNHLLALHWGVQTKKVKVWLPVRKQPWSFNPAGAATNASTNPPPLLLESSNIVPSQVELTNVEPVQTEATNPPLAHTDTTNISTQSGTTISNALLPEASPP